MLLGHLLLTLVAVMIVGRSLGRLFRLVGQPPVIGEVIGGILLGPSLLGWISPEAYAFVLPPALAPVLGAVSQLGVVLYMFLVGLEVNPSQLRGQWRATVFTSNAGIIVPFGLGLALAVYLHPRYAPAGVPFTNFALFIGIAMSITAFPVLARILEHLGITKTTIGSAALAAAAIDDVTAWCLLAFVVGVVQARPETAMFVAGLTVVFIAVMLIVVRPLVARLPAVKDDRAPTTGRLAVAVVGALIAALATEAIGIHAIFGAFLFGVMIPHDSRLAAALRQRFEDPITILLLPAFFAFTGMRTEVGLLTGVNEWLICAAIIAIASIGKIGGVFGAARLTGFTTRQSAGLGVLMNTRGLMELIVLNVGLELGVLSPVLFTMLVLMAIATTVATTPILRRIGWT